MAALPPRPPGLTARGSPPVPVPEAAAPAGAAGGTPRAHLAAGGPGAGRGGAGARPPPSGAVSPRRAPARTSLRPGGPASATRKAAAAAGPAPLALSAPAARTWPGSGERSAVGDRRRGRAGGGASCGRARRGDPRGPGGAGLEGVGRGGRPRAAVGPRAPHPPPLPGPSPPKATQGVGRAAAPGPPCAGERGCGRRRSGGVPGLVGSGCCLGAAARWGAGAGGDRSERGRSARCGNGGGDS